jgi:hypothetical protein
MPAKRRRPVTNSALRAALHATGLPYGKIAQNINTIGEENDVPLYYDKSTIAHWLTGTTPRPQTVPLIVETFARLLDRPDLTAHDLGWPQAAPTKPDDPWDGDAVAWLTRLGRDDMLDRRSLLKGGLYSAAALTLPDRPWHPPRRPGPSIKAGAADVARIREMTSQFALADDLFGGGHARTAIAAYLINQVTPLLHGTTGHARPELFTATARLAYLAGFMNADAGRSGAAQRYYIQSARLADEAHDPVTRATALRALSLQAVELHRPAEALDLAQTAASTLQTGAPLRVRAWMSGMLAEAHAANGNIWDALNALRLAEADVERADSVPDTEWTGGYGREALEHQTGTSLVRLGDLGAAERHLLQAIGTRKQTERRSRVLITARLASVQLHLEHPELAAKTILGIQHDIPLVSSWRADSHLNAIRARWQPYRSDPTVHEADHIIQAQQRVDLRGHTGR